MAVAQLVEPLIVIQVVAGSSTVGRPILFLYAALPFRSGKAAFAFCFQARLSFCVDPASLALT